MRLNDENRGERLYKIFIYVVLGILAVLILIPVLWVMVASVKETTEHYGSPWALPSHIHWQNFADAWTKANMGGYMFHSVTVTALALGILLVVALPASYCLARLKFLYIPNKYCLLNNTAYQILMRTTIPFLHRKECILYPL